LRIVSANVLLDNTELATLAGELVATDADVIVLEEVTPEHLATLTASRRKRRSSRLIFRARSGWRCTMGSRSRRLSP
ncbi:hypothetical protein, partial [Pseudomonas sp. RTS4]|uniref:hypothetical protein n=1 Tax=Pseudomonas sp. RTS4 TaxID=3048644 RepID=UPI002B2387C3